MGEEVGGPGWGERAPEGPSAFKTWWLLLINLVVTSKSRILPKGWASPAGKQMTQDLGKSKIGNAMKGEDRPDRKRREKSKTKRISYN